MEYPQYYVVLVWNYHLLIVLNLVISGIPSIPTEEGEIETALDVLNLVISGIPSILLRMSFKVIANNNVLNLVISGIPSILYEKTWYPWF